MNYFCPGSVNTHWGPGPVNTNWASGPVNTNWGPGPGPRTRQRAGGREIQIPYFFQILLTSFKEL